MKNLLVVFSNPAEGRQDEFNQWYDERHVEDVLSIEGFSAVQRFELVDFDSAPDFGHKYLALYEIEDPDAAHAMASLAAAADTPAMIMSEALDREGVLARCFKPMAGRVVRRPDAAEQR